MSNNDGEKSSTDSDRPIDAGRRKFLFILPLGIFASIAGYVAAAAFRFLRPVNLVQRETEWLNAMPMANIKGEKPMMCSVMTEQNAGWSMTQAEQQVIILPANNRQALSSACPHEGCSVSWRDESNDFFCPCHDSIFSPDGAWVSGPARRGLDPLPTREKDGMLQIKFQTFANNTVDRVPRA
jgi:menaquinol-cytochrome c reductase iron-sulfur subunit